MPRCPFCGEEISCLLAEVRYLGYKTFTVSLGSGYLKWESPDHGNEEDELLTGYRCPRCNAVVFLGDTPTDRIEAFLRGLLECGIGREKTDDETYEKWSEREW